VSFKFKILLIARMKTLIKLVFILAFVFPKAIYSQSSSSKFDIQFQLKTEIKNINKACLPCGRIGNKIIDSINRQLGIDYCNKVRIAKHPARYQYYIKYSTAINVDSVVALFKQTLLAANVQAYSK
jgi:hypothetical protein